MAHRAQRRNGDEDRVRFAAASGGADPGRRSGLHRRRVGRAPVETPGSPLPAGRQRVFALLWLLRRRGGVSAA